jgi:hypothetical protein
MGGDKRATAGAVGSGRLRLVPSASAHAPARQCDLYRTAGIWRSVTFGECRLERCEDSNLHNQT